MATRAARANTFDRECRRVLSTDARWRYVCDQWKRTEQSRIIDANRVKHLLQGCNEP